MNKAGLIEVVSARLGDRRTASTAVEAVVDAITRAVAAGEKVGISGFGVFERVERAARTARNPTTGEAVPLDRTTVPKFRPGQGFKDIVSGAKEVGPSGARAVTARAGVPRAPRPGAGAAAPGRTATTAARRSPAKTARAAAPARTTPTTPTKAPTKAARTTTAAPAGTTRAAGAPSGRTVAAPGAARSAAAAKAPAKSASRVAAPAKAATKAAKAPATRSARSS